MILILIKTALSKKFDIYRRGRGLSVHILKWTDELEQDYQ